MSRQFKLLTLFSLILSLCLFAFHPNSIQADTKEDSLVYGINTTPTGVFNPLLSDSIYDSAVCGFVYDSLLKMDKEMKLQPGLAESYEVSKDNLSLSFTLRKGLKWSDGKDLTPEDVRFTLESLADKKYDGASSGFVDKLKGAKDYTDGKADHIEGITIEGNVIRLTFAKPYAPALTNIGTLGIIPQHIWSKIDISEWKKNKDIKKFIGSGPYILDQFKEGQFVKFSANPNYYEKVKTPKVIMKVVNEEAVLAELKNGSVDIADVSNLKQTDKDGLKKDGFAIHSHENPMIQVMGLNMTSKKLQDKNLRHAMMYAINRKGMVDQLLEGNGEVASTTILKSSWAYPEKDQLNDYSYDLKKAKKILTDNGYSYKKDVLYKDGKAVTLKLICPTGNVMREKTAQIIQQNLKELGIKVTIDAMEFPAMMDIIFAKDKKYEAFMMGSNQAIDPDTSAYWSSKGAWNMTGFANDEADKLLEKGNSVLNLDERKAIYQDFGKLINDELPFLYLYNQNVQIASNKRVSGFNPSVFRDFSNAHEWAIR